MKRVAFTMKILPGKKEEYIKRHYELWPEIKRLFKKEGIKEYSIFLEEETDTLFAFQKVSGGKNSQNLSENLIVQKWWKFMSDIMETNPDHSPVSRPLIQVFNMD